MDSSSSSSSISPEQQHQLQRFLQISLNSTAVSSLFGLQSSILHFFSNQLFEMEKVVDLSEDNPIDLDNVEGDNDTDLSTGISQTSKKRSRTFLSKVWNDYIIFPGLDENGHVVAKCKRCGEIIRADSTQGTGNPKRHIEKCQRTTYRDIGQMVIGNSDSSLSTRASKFNPDVFRELVSMAIVRHDLPYQFVEYEGVRELIQYASLANSEDQVRLKSRNTVKSDINKIYVREKGNLKKLLHSIRGKICVTSDLWTSIANDGYITLTAHFIDQEWNLQKKILSFSYMPTPHTGAAICEKLYTLLCDWGIEKKLFSMTLDNASSNDVCVSLLRSQLNLRGSLVSNGEFFHIRCCCHILNLIVRDGLKDVDPAVLKVRESVKYFRGSQARKKAFYESVKAVGLPTKKGLRQDVCTRWDSTYYMLDSAIFYRVAFLNLSLGKDPNYTECPDNVQWSQLEKICKFLGTFAAVTKLFSGTLYPTSNLFFPQVCEIQQVIQNAVNDPDEFMSKMGKNMEAKFNKYWSDHNKILAICVIFDPRYKLQFVEFCYARLYGPNSPQMASVKASLYHLFNLYVKAYAPEPTVTQRSDQSQIPNTMHENSILQAFVESEEYVSTNSQQASQLDLYLMEKNMPISDKLDVLLFWKANQFRFPELSRLACDLLSIPISSVASESAFSAGGRVLDQYRSALLPLNVEALICTNDWLCKKKDKLEATYEELTEDILEEFRNEEQIEHSQSSNILV